MKFSQVILILFIVNLLNLFIGFSIQSNDITTLESLVDGWFTDSTTGFFGNNQDSITKFTNSSNWAVKFAGEFLTGLTSAINLALMGFQLILIVLWAWITPISHIVFVSEEITFLKFLGFIALLYIHWFNLMAVIKLFKFIKGSDT